MRVFLDTSAFVKIFIAEIGTSLVIELIEQADLVGISTICIPECIATLNRLRRQGILKMADYMRIKKHVSVIIEEMEIISLSTVAIRESVEAIEKFPLRGMDAIHIGCALAWRPDLFISSDLRQLDAARGMQLKVKRV